MRINNKTYEERVDVLVIGSGFAGLSAAIEAAEAGATVLVVEKNCSTGGNSRISDGGIAAPDTDVQRKFGYKDSKELFYRDILASGMGLNHPELVHTLVEKAAEAFRWSREVLEVPYLDRVDIFGGHSVHRCYAAEKISGSTIIGKQLEYLDHLGVEIRKAARFDRFLTGSDGELTGAEVSPSGTAEESDPNEERRSSCRISAGAIVLASGGYGADVDFRSAQDPRLDESIGTSNRPTATAEVLKAALRMGALPVQLSSIQLGPWASPDEKGFGHGPMFSEYILFQYGMIIDPSTGRRFVNELSDRKRLSDAIFSIGAPCVGIADHQAVLTAGWDISTALRKGVVKTFENLSDLAAEYGVPESPLIGSVERFNGHVSAGKDADYGKPVIQDAAPLAVPPFYAIRLWPKVHHVSGGLGIDENARVLDLDRRPIAKLYAAGEVCGGIHGANRLGSCAITECLVFGRIAGRNAAGITR